MTGPDDDASRFIGTLLAGASNSPDACAYLWHTDRTSNRKTTQSFPLRDPATASDMAEVAVRLGQDVYVGTTLSGRKLERHERVRADNAAGLFGVFIDIDVAGPLHKKPNLPTSTSQALDLLEDMPITPTMVVQSGHGLQSWWLFHEVWRFTHEEDRARGAALLEGFVGAYAALGTERGWVVDPVGDLARVLRVPGTINGKDADQPVPVTLWACGEERYDVEDVVAIIDRIGHRRVSAPATAPSPSRAIDVPSFVLDPDAVPPADKLAALLTSSSKAAGSWAYDRPDLQDQSPSSIDASLASLCARTGAWSDQEIVDLLIAARRNNHKPPKLKPDYYTRTLSFARAGTTVGGPGSAPDGGPDEEEESNPFEARIKAMGVVPALVDVLEDEQHFAIDTSGLIHRFEGGVYRDGRPSIRSFARTELETRGCSKSWKASLPNHVASYLAASAPRLWDHPGTEFLNVANGVVHLPTLELQPHTPALLHSIQLPVAYDPDARCPAWDSFVQDTFPEDAIHTAYELVAFLIVPDSSIQKAVMLVGEGGNGKSTYLRGVQALLGTRNFSTMPLHRLEAERFAAASLVGKLANICADLAASDLAGSSVLKSITGGDRITGERKYHDAFDFQPLARLVFSANSPPRTPDATEAFFQRWFVVPFERTFRGEKEEIPARVLDARLADPGELSGVLNRALQALPALRERGLAEPLSLVAARERFRAETDPFSVWLDQATINLPDAVIPKALLVDAYNARARSAGIPTLTANSFTRQLKRARTKIGTAQRMVAGRHTDVYTGIGLREAVSAVSEVM